MDLQVEPILLCLAVLLAVFAFYLYVKHSQSYWEKQNVPTPPFHFLLGHSLPRIQKTRSSWELLDDYYRQFKGAADYVGLYFATEPALLVLDLDLVKRIIITDFAVFNSRGVYVNEKDDPISEHLFSMGGQKWRKLRNKLSPIFTSGKLKMMYPTIVQIADQLTKTFQAKVDDHPGGFPIKDVTSRFTTDVIGNCAFGIECNSLKDPENPFRKIGDKVFRRTFCRGISALFKAQYPNLSKTLRLKSLPADVSKFYTEVVEQTVSHREDSGEARNDFVELLLKLKNEGNSADRITLQEIVSQSFIFFVAGFETSSSTMMFCLYEMARNPDIQEIAREHIRSCMGKYNNKLTYECLQEMDYLEKIVYETLRMYPSVPTLSRRADKDYQIPNSKVIIKRGTNVFLPIKSIQMDPEYFPDPLEFNPKRFDKEEIGKRHQCAFLGFGEGPRICIGLRFGILQAKVGLAALLSNFKFSLSDETEEPLEMDKFAFVLMPRNDIHLKVERNKPDFDWPGK